MDALALAAQVRAGEVSPRELAEQAIARIEATNPQLNFLVTDCFEQALAASPPEGPFAGVPMLVKDLTETLGVRTTFSCKAFADYVPERDMAVVQRMKEAGFVVLGKSNTPEFGSTAVTESELNGACRNPWDTSRTPGGSSGGAASAVAAGVLPLAHASDGGGSIRIPAACCGLYGLKPSRGRVSGAPYGGGSLELGQNGCVSVSVRDTAAFLDAVSGPVAGDPHWAPPPARPFLEEVGADPGRLRIAVTAETPTGLEVEPVVVEVMRAAAEALSSLGHEVIEATPPWRDENALLQFARLWSIGPALYPVPDRSLMEPLNRALADAADAASSADYARSVAWFQGFARRIVEFWADVDVVLTPALGMPPAEVGWVTGPDDPWEQYRRAGLFTPYTPLVNITGQPAAAVPWTVVDGLPAGIQLIGPPAGEAVLLRLSAQIEEAYPWAGRHPKEVWAG